MCGDGRLVDMKAYVNGRLGGIEAGACCACGACGARNYNRFPHLFDVRRRTDFSYYITLQGVFSFDSFAQRTRHKKKPVFCLGPN